MVAITGSAKPDFIGRNARSILFHEFLQVLERLEGREIFCQADLRRRNPSEHRFKRLRGHLEILSLSNLPAIPKDRHPFYL